MAWATPFTATTGQVVTAANMNEIRDNLRYLKGLDGTVVIEAAVQYYSSSADNKILMIPTGTTASLAVLNGSTSAYKDFDIQGARIKIVPDTVNAVGGMMFFATNDISSGTVTVVPSGVTRRYYCVGVSYNMTTGGAFQITAGSTAGGTTDIYSDGGTNILRVTVAAGVMTVARAAGTSTYDVVMTVWYQ